MVVGANDVKLFLSGGTANSDVNASLGGGISNTEISLSGINNLFDDVGSAQVRDGHTDYRCFYIKNNHAADTMSNVSLSISSPSPSTSTAIEFSPVSLDQVGVLPNDTTAPSIQPLGSSTEIGTTPLSSSAIAVRFGFIFVPAYFGGSTRIRIFRESDFQQTGFTTILADIAPHGADVGASSSGSWPYFLYYIDDYGNGLVISQVAITSTGAFSGENFVDNGPLHAENTTPRGLAVSNNANNEIFVLDQARKELFMYSRYTTLTHAENVSRYRRRFPLSGLGDNAEGISTDGTYLYIVDSVLDTIFIYYLNTGAYLTQLNLDPDNSNPRAISVTDDYIYTADYDSRKIHRYIKPRILRLRSVPASMPNIPPNGTEAVWVKRTVDANATGYISDGPTLGLTWD